MRQYLYILLTFILLVNTNTIIANTPDKEIVRSDSNISGHVIDKNTGEHLAYVTIIVKGTNIHVTTDASGHYILHNAPLGKITLEASFVGYISKQQEVLVEKNKFIEINFELAEDVMILEQVVVSGSRSETKRKNSPSLVNIVNDKMFDATASTTVADALSYQPGVRIEEDCQNCGLPQVRINGLDGQYSQILMDSKPVFSALTGVYGIEQIPANMIDRVEVVRGGGSALFGSSAIAGTINIITKEPTYNSAEVANTTTSLGISGAID